MRYQLVLFMNDPQKPKRGRPSTMNAENVLDTAMHAYWRADPADVSINAVCQLAAVSKPALYRGFGNEAALPSAELTSYAEQVLSEVFVILAHDITLQETVTALIRFACDAPELETGCVFYKIRRQASARPKDPRSSGRDRRVRRQSLHGFFERCRATGELANKVSASTAAKYLVAQIGLALKQRTAGENPTQIRDTLELALTKLR